jgi:hypothetical protein
MDPRTAAENLAEGNGTYDLATIVKNPEAYLEPMKDEDTVHTSDIEGFGRYASRRGLQRFEDAGVVRQNGNRNSFDVVEDVDDEYIEVVSEYFEEFGDEFL